MLSGREAEQFGGGLNKGELANKDASSISSDVSSLKRMQKSSYTDTLSSSGRVILRFGE